MHKVKKFTDTGYFRDDVFRGPWLWLEDDLLVSLMGETLEVKSDGTVKKIPVSLGQLRQGFSPDGSFSVVSTGRELRVVDLISGETQQFPVGQRMRKLLWLSQKKVVIQVGQDLLAEYNGVSKELQGPQQIDGGIRDILEPSPDGSCFLVVGAKSILILDPTTKRHAELKIQFNEVAWVDNEHLLCSSSAVETDQRGLWLMNKSGVGEKVSNQPLDQSTGRSFSPIAVTRVGAYIVSQGDLWLLQRRSGESTLKQITHDQKLSPELQTLDY